MGLIKTQTWKIIFGHFDLDYKFDEILEYTGHEHHDKSGKLYIHVLWYNVDQRLIDAETVKRDNPV